MGPIGACETRSGELCAPHHDIKPDRGPPRPMCRIGEAHPPDELETPRIRKTVLKKTVLGLAAVVALATAALAPTAASAHYYGHKHFKPYYGYSSYAYYKPYRPYCFSKKVWTHYGWEW